MASSPRWRFARKKVSSLEKAICLLLVLVLAGLAGLFVWDMHSSQPANPLAVDPKLLSQAARPPEIVAAAYLLPNTQAAKRAAAPTVLAPADLSSRSAALAAAAARYRSKRAILAAYDAAGSPLTAIAIETDAPESAFGLWSARKPAQARLLSAGSNAQAWRTDSAAAFWAGRYYVELSLDKAPAPSTTQPAAQASGDAAPAADPLAILLAEVSRAYVPFGRPFPAEAVLPADGLKADSLKFLADPAFGIEPLKPAFIADYESGPQIAVVALASPDAAKAALKTALKGLSKAAPTDPEAEAAAQAPPQTDAKGRATGALADGRAVILQAVDRFVVAAAAPQADQASALLDQVPAAAAAQAPTAAAAAKPASEGPLPKLQDADLTGPGEVRRFNADTLYEKIDGKAQLYLSYNFAELLFTTYTAGDTSLDVYVYDMAQADNAFGIYKAEEGENSEAIQIGAGGYASGASIFFWKGKHYVNILAGGEEPGHGSAAAASDAQKQLAMKLAAAVADQLKSSGQSLWAEQVLPQADRVAGSFEFRKSDAFGLDFLNDVFSAQYKVAGKDLTLFVMRQASPDKGQEVLDAYKAFAAKYGKILETADVAGGKVLVVQSSGTYDVVFLKDKYFGGATAADDRELAKSTVTKWVQDLAAAPAK